MGKMVVDMWKNLGQNEAHGNKHHVDAALPTSRLKASEFSVDDIGGVVWYRNCVGPPSIGVNPRS